MQNTYEYKVIKKFFTKFIINENNGKFLHMNIYVNL